MVDYNFEYLVWKSFNSVKLPLTIPFNLSIYFVKLPLSLSNSLHLSSNSLYPDIYFYNFLIINCIYSPALT